MKCLLYIAAVSILLSACAPTVTTPENSGDNNNTNCTKPPKPKITADTAYWGDTLRLHASAVTGAKTYYWRGPDFTPYYGQDIEVPYMWSHRQGKYILIVTVGENCQSDTAETEVVLKSPPAPCNLPDNTTQYEGVPGLTFYYVSCDVQNGHYTITANGNNGDLSVEFPTAAPPATDRIYMLTNYVDGFNPDPDELSIHTVAGGTFPYDYVAADGYAYVTHVNGKIKVSFCDLMFYGPDPGLEFKGSGNVICK